MNKLDEKTRTQIIHLLCEGNSLRSVTRLTGVSINTVTKLLIDACKACADFQDKAFQNLSCKHIQVDEIWSFVYAKQKNVKGAKAAPDEAGDVWTWTAIDAETKLIPSWLVGGRDGEFALAFMEDLASRLANRVQLTSDGHKAYLNAVEEVFGADIDYAMLVKIYGNGPDQSKGKYSPAPFTSAKRTAIEGDPDMNHVSTSFAERSNLTMRMHMRRFTRLTNGFSKKIENHSYAVALHMMYYNFVRIHKSLKVTPAMAAGVSANLWDVSDIVALLDAAEIAPKKRGPYKKREA